MSDLANTIASTLGSADQSLASAIQDAELAKVLDAAQSITDNMMAMGRLQGSFTSSEDVIAQALDSLKAFYSDQELVSLRSSITQQTSWVKNFSSALQAMRDQSAAIRTKLDLKRTQLATATSSSANQSAADYAASVQQVTQVIVQVHNEAAALIKDVMTPLVLAISQNMMGLMGYFDVQTTKSSDLMGMKNLIDEISSDTAEMDTLLNEFNLWEATFNKYGDLIQQQVSDATLRQTLSAIKQDFASWLPWITAVSGRQVKMKESIASAQAKYNVLESQLNASKATTSVVPVVQPSVEPAANSAVAPAAASSAATTGSSATLTVATTAASKNTLEVAAATQASSVVQVNSSLPATSDVAAAALTTSLSLATSPIVVTAGATIGTTVSGDSAEVAANGLLGAPAVAVLVENVKKVTDSVAALKPIVSGFKARLDGTKITDDFTKLNADFTSAQGNVEPLNAMIKQCLSAADAAQKLIDQDTAAGRNVASDVIQSLADQRIALVAAQQDIDGVAKALSEVTAAFNALAANFAEKTKALAKVSAAATDLANKIQTLSGDLNTIKQAIKDAQSALTTAKSGVDCDVALARLKTAQDLEVTIKNAKANEVMPAKKALSDQVVSFAQTYGALPDALSASITNKGTWLDALDATLSGYISSATSLQEKLTDLRDSLAQSDMKSLVGMTFAAQLQVLENAVRSLSQKAQVDPIMRMLDYAVTNRYGKLSVDMNRDIKAANRVKLLQIIEWIKKNNFFASKVNLLKEYSKTITQDRID